MQRVKPKELEKGDIFSEDRWPEKYEVVGFTTIDGYPAVIGEALESGERHRFGGNGAFRQPLILHENE